MHVVRRVLALASALCLVPVVARADDPYADFRVPDHHTFQWIVTGSLRSAGAYTGSTVEHSRNGDFASTLANELRWHAERETRQFDAGVRQSLDWDRSRRRDDNPFQPLSRLVEKRRTDDQNLSLFASRSDYPGGGPLFVSYGATGRASFSQDVSAQNSHELFPFAEVFRGDNEAARLYREDGTASVAAGVGRIRNVTGVYSAQLLESRLLATGRLTRPLSNDARRKIAEAYYIAPGFSAAHERPDKYFWRAVERILREDGALEGGSLDGYSLQRLLEPASNRFFVPRRAGFSVSTVVSLTETRGHIDLDDRQTSLQLSGGIPVAASAFESSDRTRTNTDAVMSGLDLEYARPAGPRWQWDFGSSARYGGGRRRATSLESFGSATWLVADRWYATAGFEHVIQNARVDGVRYLPTWRYFSSAALGYWVEDAWSLQLALQQSQENLRTRFQPAGFSRYDRVASLNLGLTYRPAGRLDAPGLGIAERRVTPPL